MRQRFWQGTFKTLGFLGLTALTRAMLQASDFVRAWGWLCAGAIGSAHWGWRLYLRDPQAR
ncbi:hypothetical protein K3Z85_30490, partial [Pseudomonas aeruginosa]|nr:hypothetical protein [Pseudomonas aeruginosa]